MGQFENKVVLITGSGQGLGLVLAKRFVAEGALVLGIGRTESKMINSEKEVNSPNYKTLTYDIGYEESWQEIIPFIEKTYGRLDILINNAGYLAMKNIKEMSFADFRETMHCDVDAVFLGMKYCFPLLKESVGNIVNIASIAAFMVGASAGNDPAYQSGKAAVIQLTKHAAGIFAPDGVRVNAVAPSGINTQMRKDYLAAHPEVVPGISRANPLPPHCAEPEDIADAVVFLASGSARMITGTHLLVDCGKMCA